MCYMWQRSCNMLNCILIDANQWGQGVDDLITYHKMILQYDSTLHNTLFDLHCYECFATREQARLHIEVYVGSMGLSVQRDLVNWE